MIQSEFEITRFDCILILVLVHLQFFVRASVVSYVTFVLSLFVPLLFFFGFFGKAVLRDCGIS